MNSYLPANVIEHFTEYVEAVRRHSKRMSQLELTPLELRFAADSTAIAAAAAVYLEHGIFNDVQFLKATAMSATFCLAVIKGDSPIYDIYFDGNDELISGKTEEDYVNYCNADGRLPILWRHDIVALNFKNGAEK